MYDQIQIIYVGTAGKHVLQRHSHNAQYCIFNIVLQHTEIVVLFQSAWHQHAVLYFSSFLSFSCVLVLIENEILRCHTVPLKQQVQTVFFNYF